MPYDHRKLKRKAILFKDKISYKFNLNVRRLPMNMKEHILAAMKEQSVGKNFSPA
jgi:hypothetical protein